MKCVSQSRLIAAFKKTVWSHYRKHGRDLPWRHTHDPYKILVSEIMLQQTQVSRVIGKYRDFINRFPTIQSLARASLGNVLAVWRGLGYNRRALALKRAAIIVVAKHRGIIPRTVTKLDALPGIGPATAASICAFAFNLPHPYIETNIRRVYIRHFFQRGKKVSDGSIFSLVEKTLDRINPREWYWALMDYGAALPRGMRNPNRRSAGYTKQTGFVGSNREIRSKLLLHILDNGPSTEQSVSDLLGIKASTVKQNLAAMLEEGFFSMRKGQYQIA